MAIDARRWMVSLAAAAASPVMAQGDALEALERAFWRCDHAATQSALDAATASQCSVVTEAFKARRFGGDFTAMLEWWRVHKEARHASLTAEAKRVASASR